MLTLILALAVGVAVGVGTNFAWPGHPVWCSVFGVLGFMLTSLGISLWVKKQLERIIGEIQTEVESIQGGLQRKINMMQAKNVGGGKGLQRRLEKEQAEGIRGALEMLERIKPLHKWNLLAEKQANTLRAQLNFQIKDFEKADKYLEKCLVADPLTHAMKMSRHFRNDEDDLEKLYKKGTKRFKGDEGVLIYALYSWILVKRREIDDAVTVLNKGREETDSEVLQTNWESLVNGRIRRFSNAGLGDQWYALHLEKPKPIKVRQRSMRRRRR